MYDGAAWLPPWAVEPASAIVGAQSLRGAVRRAAAPA